MAATPDAPPTDPEDLRKYCAQLLTELGDKQQLIDKLTHQLALFRRCLYGRGSEQLDPAQPLLEFASRVQAQETAAAPAVPIPAPPIPARPRPGHGRTPLPARLPRRRVEHTLPEERCTCAACGTRLVEIGEEASEQLDHQPASLFVTDHVRFTYVCQGLLAQVITDPVRLGRRGGGCAHAVLGGPQDRWAHEQDYPHRRHRGLGAGSRSDRDPGRAGVGVCGDGRPADLVYDYTADRTRGGPIAFLGDFRGYLQADAYAGYDAVYATGRVVELACWAHARRYFFDAQASDPARALPALGFIQQLYAVERAVKRVEAKIRRARRAEQAAGADARSAVAGTALTRYTEDGALAIDNNVSERALRTVVTGRNNCTFCGSDAGSHRAAILCSLVATCKAHGIDPCAHLRDVLDRLPTHPNRCRADLLPRQWKAARAVTSA